jgi:hypothetical protein
MNKVMHFFKTKYEDILSPATACSTRMINDQFFECKVKRPNPKYCEFSLSSGDGFICRHEDRKLFSGK